MNASKNIQALKSKLGSKLTIVGHHYQRESVIKHTDLRGDSLELARKIAEITSEHIVFCGVFFMAESAALLARQGQKIYLPDFGANCSMAQMAVASTLEEVLIRLNSTGRKVVPLAYVNSSLAVKHIVGKYHGAVCTSANAEKMMRWAQKQGDAVLFLPDKNLGINVANSIGIAANNCLVLDIRKEGRTFDLEATKNAKLLLWPGLCSIHEKFKVTQIEAMRAKYPNAKVVVHPESSPQVVQASDASGSTSFIIDFVEKSPQGSTIIIGTELNLVSRLQNLHKGRVNVLPLKASECVNMAKITEQNLELVLQEISVGNETHRVLAPIELMENAKLSLERMLDVCAS